MEVTSGGCAVISEALQPMSCCTILGLSDSHVQIGKWHVLNMKCLSKWLRHGTGYEMFSTSVSDSFHLVVWIEDPSRAWPTILEPLKSQYGEVVWLYCLGLGSVSLDFHKCQVASWFVYEERLGLLGNEKRTLSECLSQLWTERRVDRLGRTCHYPLYGSVDLSKTWELRRT